MNRLLFLVLLAVAPGGFAQQNPRPGILELTDGSTLHGALGSVDGHRQLSWSHPGAKSALQFSLSNMASVRFEEAVPPKHDFTPTARFQFKNGDEVVGNVRA